MLLTIATVSAMTASTAFAAPKADELELQVSLGDKKVGTETLRTQAGQEGRYDSIDANLQDKVAKMWKAFQQRAALDREANGTVKGYRRGVYVKGATISTTLFAYPGGWRVGAQADAGAKPKVTDVKLSQPFVVLDERMLSLVIVAAEAMAKTGEADYVRVDNATYGHLKLTTETLTGPEGKHWTRIHLHGDGKTPIHVEVLKGPGGHVVQVKGLDGWSAVVSGQKVPALLASTGKDPTPVELPKAVSPTQAPARSK